MTHPHTLRFPFLLFMLLVACVFQPKALQLSAPSQFEKGSTLQKVFPKALQTSSLFSALNIKNPKRCSWRLLSNQPDKVIHLLCPHQTVGLRIFGRTIYAQNRGAHRAKLAGNLGLGPKLLYTSPKNAVLAWAWAEGKPLGLPLSSSDLFQIAALLRKLHHIPLKEAQFEKPYPLQARALKRLEELEKITCPELNIPLMKKSIALIMKKLAPVEKRVMIHADLHQRHILKTPQNQLIFIDWGDSTTGDPFDDLAAISLFYALSSSQEETFLHAYLQRVPTPTEQGKLYLKKLLALLHYSLWHLRQSKAPLKPHANKKPDSTPLHPKEPCPDPASISSFREWMQTFGAESHFTGHPQKSKEIAHLGLRYFYQEIQSKRYEKVGREVIH